MNIKFFYRHMKSMKHPKEAAEPNGTRVTEGALRGKENC